MDVFIRSLGIILVGALVFSIAVPTVFSVSIISSSIHLYEAQYSFLENTLFVSLPPSLYVYYSNLSHTISNDSQYSRFVTPKTMQPIADNILNRTRALPNAEEQFANEVLAFVHQIPYNITGAKYPVETLVDNQGDCGAISLLAASIMKAGGLDVVLLKYVGTDFAHMNVGVNLPSDPVYSSLFFTSTSFEHNNKTYWTAEATPQANWRVGDQPASMGGAITTIISLTQSEENSPGQVSCHVESLLSSSISIETSSKPPNAEADRSLLIWGSTEPKMIEAPVTVYIIKDYKMDFIKTITDSKGDYSLVWNFTEDGTYHVISSYSGNSTFAGADSESIAIFVGPPSLFQFQAETYNYIVGIPIGDIAIKPYMGVKDFLNAPIEVTQSFSYNFSIHSTGQTTSEIDTTSVTIQASEHVIRGRNRISQIIKTPPKTLTLPEEIPLGLKPLALPADFNQTIQNQFCFIVKKTIDGNHTFNAQGLDSFEVSTIKEADSDTLFINATDILEENKWYTVSTLISKDKTALVIEDENGNIIENLSSGHSADSSTQIVLDVANNVDSAIAVRDFQINDKVVTVDPSSQIVHLPPAPPKSLLSFGITVIAISIGLMVIGLAVRIKKKGLFQS